MKKQYLLILILALAMTSIQAFALGPLKDREQFIFTSPLPFEAIDCTATNTSDREIEVDLIEGEDLPGLLADTRIIGPGQTFGFSASGDSTNVFCGLSWVGKPHEFRGTGCRVLVDAERFGTTCIEMW